MIRLTRLVVILGTTTLAGCSGNDTTVSPPPHPSSIVIAGGNSQTGTVSHSLSIALAVQVINTDGSPAVNVAVEWAVRSGSGRLSDSSVRTDSQGRSSVTWTLGNVPGNQSVAAVVAGLAGSPVDFTAIGVAPVVLHFNGTGWSTLLEDTSGVGIDLRSIWGSSASDIYAVGACNHNFRRLRYDGRGWSAPGLCQSPGVYSQYTSVWGNSAADVFVVGRGLFLSFEIWIDHFDGQSWSVVYDVVCNQCVSHGVRAGWSRTATDVIVVGDAGEVLHYNGVNWISEASGTNANLNAVWGTGTSGGVFAVGDDGAIVYYDGSTWRQHTSGTTQPLYAVWGTSPNDVFAVGGGGTILHYDGTAWTTQASGTTQTLLGVWGSSGSSVFAVGVASTILHYDGTNWTPQSAGASMDLGGIWGSSPTNVFVVGAPR